MHPETPRFQNGFAAIAAIFLVVILAALGGFMLTFSNTQQLTSAQDLQGTRALWAARAGVEFGVGTVVSASSCPASSPVLLSVDGFSVCVACSDQTHTEGATVVHIHQITANARSVAMTSCTDLSPVQAALGTVGFVERSVSASVER